MERYEKLGAFYLGRPYDPTREQEADSPLLYDSKDLLTHAVCVGMTGSGKTGLGVALIEEAAIDGIPALVIDPKGDMGNLLLTFPELRPEDFRPWIDEDDARREGLQAEAYAARLAERWRTGLAASAQDGARIRRLREAAEFAIYTPGSTAGRPVSILASFAAPPEPLRSDTELLAERASATATSLLGLIGIAADPLRSREHILLATVLGQCWQQGRDLSLGGLIRSVQEPQVTRVGVLELESFYPASDRFELAQRMNNLLAAPGFESWTAGEPLDAGRLLHTPTGRPRVAILSIAHLSDAERMFFVSMLLNQTLGWMRSRPGTTSLRALLYMDEIFGYMPPLGEPASKKPLLTLLKQARAYGLGCVLATQNPVDLDYKGLSNAGTWFLGRLQTERDKLRVLDGLEGASLGERFDRARVDATLSGLAPRVFLMHDVHEDAPVLFRTRWAMSYLRGPLTREQIRTLMRDRPAEAAAPGETSPAVPAAAPAPPRAAAARPVLAPQIPQVFLPARGPGEIVAYRAGLLGLARVQYVDRGSRQVVRSDELALLADLGEQGAPDWASARTLDLAEADLERDGVAAASFDTVPPEAGEVKSYAAWAKALGDTLYRSAGCDLLRSARLALTSRPGEAEREFRIRLAELGREERDGQVDRLRKKYATQVASLEERIRRAEQKVSREQEQASGQKLQTAITVGATLLSAFMGRKAASLGTVGRVATAARGAGRAAREQQDVERAREDVTGLRERLEALNRELEHEVDTLEARLDPASEPLETIALRPRRGDVEVRRVALAWIPWRQVAGGEPVTDWP